MTRSFWQPSRNISAAIMAFGSGTLLSAVAFEITIPAYKAQGFWPLLFGFLCGGLLFVAITKYSHFWMSEVQRSPNYQRSRGSQDKGCTSIAGEVFKSHTSELFVALAQFCAGGAILAMLVSTMMPESYELGGSSVSFSTILEFLLAFFVSSFNL